MIRKTDLQVVLTGLSYGVRSKVLALTYERLDEAISERGELAARIRACAENGRIAMVEGGRDCDGVHYAGKVTYVQASLVAYNAEYCRTAEWADGPFHFAIMKPSEAVEVRYRSWGGWN